MRVVLLATATAIVLLPVLAADAAGKPAEECHRLAGNPHDPAGEGEGVEYAMIDAPAAVAACRTALAAEPGNARLSYELGRALDSQGSYAEARKAYEAAASAGSGPGMRALGSLYYYGEGVGQDYGKAFALYEQALKAGFEDAAAELGDLYLDGLGTAKDPAKALELYRRGSAAGDSWATMKIGWLYESGLGVAKDEKEALKWYRQAAEAGNARGQNNLGVFYEYGRGGLTADPAEAVRLYRLAAEQKDGLALLNLSGLAFTGKGVDMDLQESLRLSRAAIETEDSDVLQGARNRAAWILAITDGDLDEALTLSTAAVEATKPDSPDWPNFVDTLAWVHHKRGDDAKALELLKSIEADSPNPSITQDHLGDIYASLGRKAEAKDAWRKALALSATDPNATPPDWDGAAVEAKLAAE